MAEPSFIERCRATWDDAWERSALLKREMVDLPPEIRTAIESSINSKTKTYRYVIPTQLIAKATDHRLDCRAVQAKADFDARSVCHEVIVPFDRLYAGVLGASPEPYVNNPLRIARIDKRAIDAQKDAKGFQHLIDVLAFAEDQPERVQDMLVFVASTIRARLVATTICYPTPRRCSADRARATLAEYVEEASGGVRLQAVSLALFQTIGARFGLFERVRANPVNAADARTGDAADLSCVDGQERVVFAVEVKDRQLTLRQAQVAATKARTTELSEFVFIVRNGVVQSDAAEVIALIDREFASGHNLYVCEFEPFLHTLLILFGETGRSELLTEVGKALDQQRADYVHRRAWQESLAKM